MFKELENIPIKFIFGNGTLSHIGEETKLYGKKALIVTGRSSTKKTGVLDRVVGYLKEQDVESVIFDKVESNPLTTTVVKAVAEIKKHNCDVVIGLGGGSPMDAAKSIAFSAANEGEITDYIFGKQGQGALPIIAVTTTAGTGSEGDSLAVLTNPETKDKKSLKSPFIYPKVSIIDPELMMTLPKHMIAATGFDALSHSVEAFLARNCSPKVEKLALEAIGTIFKYLPKVYENPKDLDSWGKVAYANTLGGIVIDQAGVVLPHGMEHPISGLLDVTHGQGLAAIFTKILEFTYKSCQEKFIKMAEVIGIDNKDKKEETIKYEIIDAFNTLMDRIDLKITLTDLGVKEEHIDWLAENALKTMTYAISNHPVKCNKNDIKMLYQVCL